jgi:tRNA (mo5U34)-methyltransferase
MPRPDILELQGRARAFEQHLQQLMAELAPQRINWYPYRTLLTFSVLDQLLTGSRRDLLDLSGGDPILDVGCADGHNSFFLESLGCQVMALDNYYTNHNQLRGFNALHSALKSSVKFQDIDLDSQFTLTEDVFGLALFLGVLYHLENPFFVLEALAHRARYCLLSTRVAQRTPDGHPMQKEPLVYLLDPQECNKDSTNHWIFSETALRRLLVQTGWTVRDFMTTGATRDSEPARPDRDERAFCLVESRVCRHYSVQLLHGWHALEQSSFRWTERRFSVEVRHPPSAAFTVLRFDFRLPGPGPVTLSAAINGTAVPPATFTTAGEHSYHIRLPREALATSPIRIDFTADQCLTAPAVDQRELALLVPFWKPGLDEADPILPSRLS